MKTLAERLKFAMANRPEITQKEIAEAAGVKPASVNDWLTGKSKSMRDGVCFHVSQKLGCSPYWLATNRGKPYPENLDMNVIPGPDLRGTVPLISWVQAGNWQEAVDNLPVGQGERIETTWKVRTHTYALRVKGDSMEPKFPDGCIVIVEPEEDARNGSYVIVRQKGDEATFKQLIHDGSHTWLKPLNPRYPIMPMADDAVICGVVKRMEMDI